MRIVPATLRIMKAQSDPLRLAILLALRSQSLIGLATRDLREAAQALYLGAKSVSDSTAMHLLLELEKEDLVRREDKRYTLTKLGTKSVATFQVYQARLLRALYATLKERVVRELGPDVDQNIVLPLQRVLPSESSGDAPSSRLIKPIPAVLRIMRIQSDHVRLAILLTLSADAGKPAPFRLLLRSMEEAVGKKVPASTLSNLVSQMEREEILARGPGAYWSLTALGSESVQAFLTYQSEIEKVVLASLKERIEKDLGINADSTPTEVTENKPAVAP